MKTWIWYLVIGLISLYIIGICNGCSSTTSTYIPSERTRYYDDSGRYVGQGVTNKFGTRYYDKSGRYIGRSK